MITPHSRITQSLQVARYAATAGISLGVIAIDQLSKASYSSYTLNINGYLSSPIPNKGAVMIASAVLLMLGIVALRAFKYPLNRMVLTGLALEIGGGVSNILDRVFLGGVRDILHLPTTAFNLADVAIVCGAVMILLSITTDLIRLSWYHSY